MMFGSVSLPTETVDTSISYGLTCFNLLLHCYSIATLLEMMFLYKVIFWKIL